LSNLPLLGAVLDSNVLLISTAVEGRAEVIVTGDADLHSLRGYAGISIISPRSFLLRVMAVSR